MYSKAKKKDSPILDKLKQLREEEVMRQKARIKHDNKNKDGRRRALVTPEDIKKAEKRLK